MFNLSDAELLEFIEKRKAEKEAAQRASTKISSADTDDIINSIQDGNENGEDEVFDEYGETRSKTKAEKRINALKNDNNIIQSFLGRRSTNSDSSDVEVAAGEPCLISFNLEVTKALLLLGFSNWSCLESEKEFDNEALVEEKLNQAVKRRYQEIKELETLSKQTKGLNNKINQFDSVRKNALGLDDNKSKQGNSPNLNTKSRHKSEKPVKTNSQKKGNPGAKKGPKSKSVGSKKEIKDDDKASLDKAKSILMKEFLRKNKQREKLKILKRTNDKMDAFNRFKKFSRPFLNPDQADPNEELKNRVQKKDMIKEKEERAERQKKLLASVNEELSDDSDDEKDSKKNTHLQDEENAEVEIEEVKETRKEPEINNKENNVPIQRKIKIEKRLSSSDSKISAAQEQAKKYLQMLEEKKKSQKAPVQKMKFDVAAYSRVNNPDSKQSLEDQKRLQSLISETAAFSQMMETT